jgi:hypothetical protein
MKRTAALFLFLLFFVPLAARAQSTTGNLEGWVVDTAGAAILGANVMATSDVLQGTRGCNTDDVGHFRLPALPPGGYSVRITHITTQPVTVENVRIFLGRTTSTGKIVLKERRIELQEIVITDTRPLIDTRSTTNGVNLTNVKFNALPIDRNYMSMMQLAPQSSPSFYGDGINISGATGIENRYFINGADVTDVFRGATGTQLPYNFVREVQIRSGAYEAEYQSSLGGIVNVLTFSGGNEMHGQVFGFYTNNRFNSGERMAVGKPAGGDFSDYDIGVSLGGPIVKNQLWYFLAYNPQFQREVVPVMGQADQNDHSTTHMFASKLSWSMNESNTVTLSVQGDPTVRRGVGISFFNGQMGPGTVLDLNAWLSDSRTGSTNIVLSGTHIIGPNILLESSLSLVSRQDEYNPVGHSEPYNYVDNTNNSVSGTFNRTFEKTSNTQAGLRGTITSEDHLLKAGIEYMNLQYDAEDVWDYLIKASDNSYLYEHRDFSGNVSSRNPSVFIQDSWQISERVSLNGGIRWDPQFLIASDGTMGQEIWGGVAPRLGIIYQPGTIGKERITASVGRFYQPVSLNLSTSYLMKGVASYDIRYMQDPRVDTAGANRSSSFSYYGNVKDLKGQYYDEVTLGYEREIYSGLKAGARLVYRRLGQAIEDAYSTNAGKSVYGNPGSPPLEEYPKATREYKSFELTVERSDAVGLSFQVSYILSRNYGNYEGLADATYSSLTGGIERWPNTSLAFWFPVGMDNALGLLPDDRTHAFKFFCSYPFSFGLTLGASGYWTSGTPLDELGIWDVPPAFTPIFLRTRGSVGRTPSIWDANIRLVYDLGGIIGTAWRPRLILDVLHLFSQKEAVQYNQQHYYDSDASGNQISPNSTYGLPVQFQPPMSVRLGMEVNF